MDEAKAKGFDAKVIDLEEFNVDILAATKLVVFMMATYGEGDPTDNATKFSLWLNSDTVPDGLLKDVNFTVFGLGNKQYQHFNKMGRLTNERLEKHGAKRVAAYGEGDDDGSLEEDFEKWKDATWETLLQRFDEQAGGNRARSRTDSMSTEKAKVELEFRVVAVAPNAVATKFNDKEINNSTKHYFHCHEATITVNRELRNQNSTAVHPNEPIGSTKHIEIDISKFDNLDYLTADNLAVLPDNNPTAVEQICKLLGFDPEMNFKLEPVDASASFKHPFPTPCTVRRALTSFFDIQGLVRHSLLSKFIPYVKDPVQKEWLKDLLQKDKLPSYKKRVEEENITIAELFSSKLSSCKVPLEDFLHIIPHLQPRYYTISSSSSLFPKSVHITISITEKELKASADSSAIRTSKKRFVGVCSDFLQNISTGSSCKIVIKASSFRLPEDNSLPVIMVGPGTGIAPMRALLQEREFRKGTGKNVLFFGCKHQQEDYIYRDELEGFQQRNVLNELHLAFSRDQADRIHVQTLMKRPETAKALMGYLDQGGYLFVCGATAMGNDVHATLVKIVEAEKKLDKAGAEAYVKTLKDTHRYVQELWS
jgi:NADPH-ferrihemoprotein reductase